VVKAHDLAREIEAEHGADDRWAVAARANADHLDRTAKLHLRDLQRGMAAND